MEQRNSNVQGLGIGLGIAVGILAVLGAITVSLKQPPLEDQLKTAIDEERYEDAAEIRDKMKNKNL